MSSSAGFPIKQDSLESMDEITLNDYKKRFAYALLKNPASSFAAALKVFPLDKGAALKISHLWPNDPYVITQQIALVETQDEEEFLPTKNEFLTTVWKRMNSALDPSDFSKLADLYAKVRDFYPDPKANAGINIMGECAKVMIVNAAPNDAAWEQKLQQQQQKLLNDGN